MRARFFCALIVAVAVLLACARPTGAVVVQGIAGSGNTSAPADDPGFANVGIRGSGSAVYLGHGWAITDMHVGAGTAWFKNQSYPMVAGSAVQLTNPPGTGLMTNTDLVMFRLSTDPQLPSLSIAGVQPGIGDQVTLIGNGRDLRSASLAYWTSAWAPSSTPSTYAGYIWASTNIMRWGTALVSAVSIPQGLLDTSETTFITTFSGATSYDAQGTPGDSGGGVFRQDSSSHQWSLAGLMFGTDSLIGQPWGTSVFGDRTYSADLSVYRTQIFQTMALPGDINFDGIVNGLDVSLVASQWLQTGAALSADANHDGVVNGLDLSLIASHWAGASSASSSAAVPEPAALELAGCAVVCAAAFALLRWGQRMPMR